MSTKTQKGTALVTGGAVRIGRALCLALAHQGYTVAIHYRGSADSASDLADDITANGVKAFTVQADLTNRDDVAGLIKAASASGPVTLLVNCASAFELDDISDFTDDSFDLHMDVHVRAPMKLTQDFAAQATKDADNQVINIIDQRVHALTPKFFTYTLSKSTLWTATQTLAQALGPQGIRVNAIGPGPTLKNARQSDEDWAKQNAATILGHGATPDDIAAAMLYLLNARSVTGQMIAVDGGQHLAWETPDVLVNE
jgi:NAD(P)-dependent dehydrogenase (short-subunit alcohol dehydrogenase family)